MTQAEAPAKLSEHDEAMILKARREAEAEAWRAERAAETKAPALPPTQANFSLAESARLAYAMSVPPGVPLDRVLEPDYLKHCASLLRPGYLIEAAAQDNKWWALMRVRKVSKEEVHCWLLQDVDLEAQLAGPVAASEADFKVAFAGAHKWRVTRIADGEVMHHGEPSEADARAWLAAFLKG